MGETSVAPSNGIAVEAVLSALSEQIASALDTEFVIIAQLQPPSRDLAYVVAAQIDGRPGQTARMVVAGTPWQEAAAVDVWVSTRDLTTYGSLHPQLAGISIAGCLIVCLRDSTSTPRGFIAVLSRRPFTNIEALSSSLKAYSTHVVTALDTRNERGDLQLAATLDATSRELTLVRTLIRTLQEDDVPMLDDRLREVADIVRRFWPDRHVLAVRVRLGSFVSTSGDLVENQGHHRLVFVTIGGDIGSIEIAYPPHAPLGRSELLEMIAGMLKRAINRHHIGLALRSSEARYRSVVEHQSDMVCRYRADTTLTFVNYAYCRFFGKPRESLIGVRFIELIPEKDRPATMAQIDALVKGEQPSMIEHAVTRPDGSLGRHQWINTAIASPDGRIEEFQAIGRDITDRWRAEEVLRSKEARLREAYQRIRSLAQRLILVQEEERTAIARDLHDDIGQQVAAVTIELSAIEQRLKKREDVGAAVVRVRRIATDLADKVRQTSHMLHPGVLKHAGLAAALASHCDAIVAQHQVRVTFEPVGSFDGVASDVALCVYRVAQQALHNVVTHARASQAHVMLTRHEETIELTVADNGRGFDPVKARARGIGLMSIEERVSLAGGSTTVDSTEGGGSTLRVEIPLTPATASPARSELTPLV